MGHRYRGAMTALVGHGETPARHPLAPGATAEAIREHLLREDRDAFDTALREARRQVGADPQAAAETLEEWRCIAIVQRDRDTFVRTARRAAEHQTGEPSPPDEPLSVTRAKAGM